MSTQQAAAPAGPAVLESADPLTALTAAGVSIWLDDLSRDRLRSGGLAQLVATSHVSGVTTNPSIFARAIEGGQAYRDQLVDLAARGADVGEALRELTTHDVRAACDVLRSVYERTDGLDGRVSIEVDARLAADSAAMIAEARSLWWSVDRPNLFIKIPATPAGLPAITACLAEGISVNVTLVFSLARYREVITAYLDGMEQARAAGHELARLDSVASFFVSRVDTEVDRRLDQLGGPAAAKLRGRAAIANARLAYAIYRDLLSTPRWRSLAEAGACPQRPLWASTSVKDPAYPDTRYVDELVAPDVVNTMPEATLRAVADHGSIPTDANRGTRTEAEGVLAELASAGVGFDDVVATLEEQGVEKFVAAWSALGERLATRMDAPRQALT